MEQIRKIEVDNKEARTGSENSGKEDHENDTGAKEIVKLNIEVELLQKVGQQKELNKRETNGCGTHGQLDQVK